MEATFHAGNRQLLYSRMKPSSMLLMFSGDPVRKTNDEYYPFFADRNFVYLTGLECKEAVLLAAQMGAAIQYDETAQSPFFTYLLEGQEHIVWFEDARSIQAKFRLAEDLTLGGAAYWNLMRPFPQNWALLSQEVAIRREEPI